MIANPALDRHVTFLRWLAGGFVIIYLQLGLVVVLAIGPTVGWGTPVLVFYLCSAIPAALIYGAARPVSRQLTRSEVGRLYAVALIRLAAALLIGQLGMVATFMLDAGVTPFILGAATATAVLAIGVWPRRADR
ncbi:hypothetical protein SAMN05444365_10395 [Micromonospora pattaloongensis]|uniref:Uncharacterized protein n=1 Tax=Micromonospora pattaloongensis TaxID=405436 RepID=A0A1H3LTT8_9ACTN|nr:hypothetical protein [Micromonospora pattaloongensis]SDY67957.1 hypothetical protein SAMN05444365_10395 [Micromonospora pattaloongensis]